MKKAVHLASPLSMVLLLAQMPAQADVLPGEWIDKALMSSDEGVRPVIEGHIESQLDWRSYYLDRRETRRTIPPPSSLRSQEPLSLNDRGTGAGVPVCLGNALIPVLEQDAGATCRREFSPT